MNSERILAVRTSKIIYRDGNLAIKVFDEDYSKADVLNEALNQARVEQSNLPIPRIMGVNVLDGKWAISTEYIKGKTLGRMMSECPEKWPEYLELFVDLQMQVHATRVSLLGRLRDSLDRKIIDADLDATVRYDLHTRLESMPRSNELCHGDFNPTNIIISENGPYILDWSHATQGCAAADVAISYLQFWLYGMKDAAEDYLAMFCEKSGLHAAQIRKWMPIVAAAKSVRAKAEDRERLLTWADKIDYE